MKKDTDLKYVVLNKSKDVDPFHYIVILGERSNGKTFAVLKYCLIDFWKNKRQAAYVRRWDTDIKQRYMTSLWDGVNSAGIVSEITNGVYDRIVYRMGKFYLANCDNEGNVKLDITPIMTTFSISSKEHSKGGNYPEIGNIVFDEMLTDTYYLPNEFILFSNVVSTIVRLRDDIKIFMIGNTISKHCPYYKEMGLYNVKTMEKGTREVYTYGNSKLKVLVIFTDSPASSKPSDVYFAFNNPSLNMITGKGGAWQIPSYPHIDVKYTPKDIAFTFFIILEDVFQCEIVITSKHNFLAIHRKTTPIKDPDKDLIFSLDVNGANNYKKYMNRGNDKLCQKIWQYFVNSKVLYQDNDTGEHIKSYIESCLSR